MGSGIIRTKKKKKIRCCCRRCNPSAALTHFRRKFVLFPRGKGERQQKKNKEEPSSCKMPDSSTTTAASWIFLLLPICVVIAVTTRYTTSQNLPMLLRVCCSCQMIIGLFMNFFSCQCLLCCMAALPMVMLHPFLLLSFKQLLSRLTVLHCNALLASTSICFPLLPSTAAAVSSRLSVVNLGL